MPTYERSTRVAAPLERVWEFHVDPSGLARLTPDWFRLRVESVTGPDGEPNPEVLDAGATMVSSVRPFGVGPRRRWTSEIVEARRSDERAVLRDRMVDGPFETWEHTHLFVADGDSDASATTVVDRVEYALPCGTAGRLVDPFAWVGLEPTFRHRHRRTRELLERDRART